jgi:hypothetical protein
MKKIIKKWLGIDVLEESIVSINVSYGFILDGVKDIKKSNDELEEHIIYIIDFFNNKSNSIVSVSPITEKKVATKKVSVKKVAKTKK